MGDLTGIITGLRAEARLLRGLPLVACAGAGAEAAARVLVAAGATRLLSFGLAGGLAPNLQPGTLVLATEIRMADQCWPTDGPWRHAVARPGMVLAPLLTVPAPLSTPDQKATAHAASGAAAVDMESGAVAKVAAGAGLPFLALRAIADPAGRSLPQATLRVVDGQGRIRPGAAAWALAAHPLATLILAAQARAAMRALGTVIGRAPGLFPRCD